MRVLITGANGFVGQHLVRDLLTSDYQVTATGMGLNGDENQLEYIQADLTDLATVAAIDFTRFDGIIHLAGLAAVGPSFDNPELYLAVNVGAQRNLLTTIVAQRAHLRFVCISSGSLYDPTARLPLHETSAVRPNSPYATSKLGQEELARSYQSKGIECIVARPFNHIGPGQATGFIVPDLAQQVVAVERDEQAAIMVGNLDAKRDYTDVRDIVRAYRLLLERGRDGETYNICSGFSVPGTAILNSLLRFTATEPVIIRDPARMRPSDTPKIFGSYAKLQRDTGWEPRIPLYRTLEDVLTEWRSR